MIALVSALLLTFMPAETAQAQSCESAVQVAADLWDEYGKVARQVGCAGVTAGTVVATGGVTLPGAVTQYQSCMARSGLVEKATDAMIKAWNDLANNNWATIGPGRLEMNTNQIGTIRGPGTRVWVTESPMSHNTLDLTIEKIRYRGKTEVTVCTHLPDGSEDVVWNFHMAPGLDNKGKVWNKEISDVAGRIVSVFLKGDPAIPGISVKSMQYRLRAEPQGRLEYREPDHTVVITSDGISGETSYTLKGGGEIQQVEGALAGFQVTKQSNDNVSGTTATGYVGGGVDGFVVFGDLPSIQFDNPQNAEVYVDGELHRSKEASTTLTEEAREWIGTYSGRGDGRRARLIIQPNSDNTALEFTFEDLDRDTELTAAIPGSQWQEGPGHVVEDLRLTGSDDNVKNIGRLFLHNDPQYISGYSEWSDRHFGVAFSEDGVSSPLNSGGRLDRSNWADEWTGAYEGHGDGRKVALTIEKPGSELELTWEGLERDVTFTATVPLSAQEDSPPHVLTDLELTSSDGRTKQVERLFLHTWDTNYISGYTEWRDSNYGVHFVQMDD